MDVTMAQICEFFGVNEHELYETPEPVLIEMHRLMKNEEIFDLHKLGYYIPVIKGKEVRR